MRRIIDLTLVLLIVVSVQVKAQQMTVVTADKTTEYAQWPYESAKITFTNGQMLFHYGNDVLGVYNIKDIKRIFFYGTDGVDLMSGKKPLAYSPRTGVISVNTQLGTSVEVYQMNGVRVLSQMHTIATDEIDVSHLPSGPYVVVAGKETLKFVKQ